MDQQAAIAQIEALRDQLATAEQFAVQWTPWDGQACLYTVAAVHFAVHPRCAPGGPGRVAESATAMTPHRPSSPVPPLRPVF